MNSEFLWYPVSLCFPQKLEISRSTLILSVETCSVPAHRLGIMGLNQPVIGFGRSVCHSSGQGNVEERSFERFVGKVYLAHERRLGGRHLSPSMLAVTVSAWAFGNCSCHLGPRRITLPGRALRMGVGGSGCGFDDTVWLPNPGSTHLWTSYCMS